jgi:apolipoprotein N-acyltransferase
VLSFPDFGDRYHLDLLVFVALVPLLWGTQGAGGRRGFFLGWLCGVTLECAGFIWILYAIREFTALNPVLSSLCFVLWLLFSSVPWGCLGALLGRVRGSLDLVGVILLWVAIEHLYPRLFPWHLGGALYARSWLLQCVDLAGASGLTALVFVVNVALWRLFFYLWRRGGTPLPWSSLACAAIVVGAALLYGAWRERSVLEVEGAVRPSLKVGFIQGAIDPKERLRSRRSLEYYLDRTRELMREHPDLDLVLWPEAADSRAFDLTGGWDPWVFHRRARSGASRPEVLLRGELPVPLVAGAGGFVHRGDPSDTESWEAVFNVQFYLRPDGRLEFYKKNKPIPIGEELPGLDLVPESWVRALGLRHIGNIQRGTENPLMDLGGRKFRNLICYEAVLPDYARRSALGADFLVNLTEDYWYGRTAHVRQHVSVLILRAVESRVPVLRCTNAGPSGIVEPSGRFQRNDRLFEEDRFAFRFVPRSEWSFYREWGHHFPLAAGLAGVGLAVRRRWRPQAASAPV